MDRQYRAARVLHEARFQAVRVLPRSELPVGALFQKPVALIGANAAPLFTEQLISPSPAEAVPA
jgi:hypothetical protein